MCFLLISVLMYSKSVTINSPTNSDLVIIMIHIFFVLSFACFPFGQYLKSFNKLPKRQMSVYHKNHHRLADRPWFVAELIVNALTYILYYIIF